MNLVKHAEVDNEHMGVMKVLGLGHGMIRTCGQATSRCSYMSTFHEFLPLDVTARLTVAYPFVGHVNTCPMPSARWPNPSQGLNTVDAFERTNILDRTSIIVIENVPSIFWYNSKRQLGPMGNR